MLNIVEVDTSIRMVEQLKKLGFSVTSVDVATVEDLREWLVGGFYAASLVDLDRTGWASREIAALRRIAVHTPVIGLGTPTPEQCWSSARAELLDAGADDCLRKPATAGEIAATVRAVSRRSAGRSSNIFELRSGDAVVLVDELARTVSVNGAPVHFTQKMFEVFLVLVSARGRAVSRRYLMDCVYAQLESAPEAHIIQVVICKLRRDLAIAHPHASGIIQTVRGWGYRSSSVRQVGR